jgi:hypothetical protein
LYWLVALLTVFSLGIGFALIAGAAASKATPVCKTGQKSTKKRPCIPHCKPGQKSTKTHPCIKVKTAAATTTTKPTSAAGGGASSGSSGTTTSAGGGGGAGVGGGLQANGCAVGQVIPQGAYAGDGDEDNTNGGDPEDGDGCL